MSSPFTRQTLEDWEDSYGDAWSSEIVRETRSEPAQVRFHVYCLGHLQRWRQGRG